MPDDGGIARFKARLAAIPKNVLEASQKTALGQAKKTAATMEQLVPVDTGDLKDSITVTAGGQQTPAYSQPGGSMVVPENAVAITAGDHVVRYAHLVEYGTKKSHAEPYFWPAVRLHNKAARTAIKRSGARALRKNWGKK